MPAAIEPCAAIAGVRLKQAQSELTPLLRSRDNGPEGDASLVLLRAQVRSIFTPPILRHSHMILKCLANFILILLALLTGCEAVKAKPSEESLIALYLEELKDAAKGVTPPVEFRRDGRKIKFGVWAIQIVSVDFQRPSESTFSDTDQYSWIGRINVRWYRNGKEIPRESVYFGMGIPNYLARRDFDDKFIALCDRLSNEWVPYHSSSTNAATGQRGDG